MVLCRLRVVTAAIILTACGQMAQAADEIAVIHALRNQSNLGLLTHQIDPVLASLSEDFVGVGANGGVKVLNKPQVRELYLKTFADPDFVSYVRQPRDITLSDDGLHASERGEWQGIFKNDKGGALASGDYLAYWAKRDGKWVDLTEVYIAVHCTGTQC